MNHRKRRQDAGIRVEKPSPRNLRAIKLARLSVMRVQGPIDVCDTVGTAFR